MNSVTRRRLSILVGLLLIVGGYLAMNMMFGLKETEPKKTDPIRRKAASAIVVTNGAVPTTIDLQGRLQAFNKIGIFSEVTGTLEATGRPFKVGTYFPRGSVLMRIDDNETVLSLQAQKASLLTSIATMMPDLRIDYPNSLAQWEAYLADFSVDDPLPALPEPVDQRERLFVAGRNLNTQYYTIKGLEERLTKYQIIAPFSGVLTQANIDAGAVVRAGQQLGELMAQGSYELVATVPLTQLKFLKVGNSVELYGNGVEGTRTGRIKRISDQIDGASQTVQVFVGVEGEGLREGMYLQGEAAAATLENVVRIDRNLLVNDEAVFVVDQDSILRLQSVSVAKMDRNTAIVQGLPDGSKLVTDVPAGAHDGMIITLNQ